MASIGLTGFYVAKYTTEKDSSGKDKIVFTDGKKVSKAVTLNITNNKSTVSRYADDGKVDEEKSFNGSSLTATPDDVNENIYDLLGWEKKTFTFGDEEVECTGVGNDSTPPRMGFGYIETTKENGTRKYHARIYSNTDWSMPDSETAQTKGESLSFNDQTILGSTYEDAYGKYFYEGFFTTFSAAQDFIGKILDISALVTA